MEESPEGNGRVRRCGHRPIDHNGDGSFLFFPSRNMWLFLFFPSRTIWLFLFNQASLFGLYELILSIGFFYLENHHVHKMLIYIFIIIEQNNIKTLKIFYWNHYTRKKNSHTCVKKTMKRKQFLFLFFHLHLTRINKRVTVSEIFKN